MSFALNVIAKATLILIAAVLTAVGLRRASASVRHTVWALAILSALVLPFAAAIVPQLQLPLWPERSTSVRLMPVAVSTAVAGREPGPQSSRERPTTEFFFVLWGAGVVLSLVRLAAGVLRARRLAISAVEPHDESWRQIAGQVSLALDCGKPIWLLFSDAEVSPMTWGVWRHRILLPSSASEWSTERRRLVLAHELAHVKRNDGVVHLFVQLACSVYWFNPLIWYAARRACIERERACDDQVLNLGGAAEDYADHLVQIVRGLRARKSLSVSAVAMAQPSQLEARLASILDVRTGRRTLSKAGLFVLCALSGLMTLSIAGINVTGAVPSPPVLVVPTKLALPPETKAVPAPPQRTHIGDSGAVTNSTVVPPQVIQSMPLFAAVDGTVTLELSVDAQGNATVLRVVKGLGSDLDAKATAAVETWEFAPALKDGLPVAAITQVDVDFKRTMEAIRIGPGVSPPRVVSRVEPRYTDEARSVRAQGTVVLEAIIHKDGSVEIVRVVRSIGSGLDDSAIAALKQWVFKPAMKDGAAVDVAINIEVNFNLRDKPPADGTTPTSGSGSKVDSPQ